MFGAAGLHRGPAGQTKKAGAAIAAPALVRESGESYGAAFTIACTVKKSLSTAPILMYQHSRSGVCCPGR
jgi:hypothetical protein